jgi:hypothetical protein
MKKKLALLAVLAMASSAYAQGIITFFSLNEVTKNAALGGGTAGSGPGAYTAGLFLASDVNTPLGTTDFVAGTGYLNAIDITVPGFGVGSSPIFVVRAWETGKTYATSGARGEHAPFTAGPLGGPQPPNPPATPPDLGAGFTGFQIVPEPSTYALGALGLGALAMMRRRK